MIASKDTLEPKSSDYVMPNSQRVYVEGEIHPEVRVPFREISLAPTKDFNGQLEPNEPVRVYDTSGPWGDPQFAGDSSKGIPALREKWIRGRGDVAEYDGREIKPRRQRLPHARPRRIRQPGRAPKSASTISKARNANRSAPAPAIPSRNSGMRARASSRPRWNSSRSAKIIGREVAEGRRQQDEPRAPIFVIHPSYFILRSATRSPTSTPAKASAPRSRPKSPPNSSAPKSPAAAPSSRPTSTIPSSSR